VEKYIFKLWSTARNRVHHGTEYITEQKFYSISAEEYYNEVEMINTMSAYAVICWDFKYSSKIYEETFFSSMYL
jgi:hypothetical protein